MTLFDLLDQLHEYEAKARPTPIAPRRDTLVIDVVSPLLCDTKHDGSLSAS